MKRASNSGISQVHWDSILKIFLNNPKLNSMVLFGSRAKDDFQPGSDIDIALKANELDLNDILSYKVKLDDLNLPYLFVYFSFQKY
jgi:predicted nucleotidyltransferase